MHSDLSLDGWDGYFWGLATSRSLNSTVDPEVPTSRRLARGGNSIAAETLQLQHVHDLHHQSDLKVCEQLYNAFNQLTNRQAFAAC